MTEVAVEIDTTSNTKDEQLLQEQLSALQLDNASMLDEDAKGDAAAEHSDEENLKGAGKKRGAEKRREGTLVQRGVTGHVKWFSVMNGYGFIERSDNDKDIFVHKSAIIRSNPKKFFTSLLKDEEVEFDVVTGIKGAEAAAVTGIGGKPVKGFKFVDGRRFRGPPRGERRKGENNGASGDGPDAESRNEKLNHDAPVKGRGNRRRYTSDGKTDGSNTEMSEGKGDAAPSAPRSRRRRAHGRPSSKMSGKKSSEEKKADDGSVEEAKKSKDENAESKLEEPKAQSEAQD